MSVSISKGNIKMGSIASVSLPAIITCRQCECHKKCYARKIERLRPNVAKAYQNNLQILNTDPDNYWREVEAAIMLARYFRFHVSGDIPDATYFCKMAEVAERNQHCEILCFTKKYDIVNDFVSCGLKVPSNLHVIFSAWTGLEMQNPNQFPEAHVKYKDGSTTAKEDAVLCGGNCTECAQIGEGCWILKNGEQVIFNEH